MPEKLYQYSIAVDNGKRMFWGGFETIIGLSADH
jgi:uncharacterized protein YbaA (DUF1428 family)